MTGGIVAATVTIGNHWQPKGIALNLDDILACAIAGLLVIGLGLLVRRRITSGVPGRAQLVYEFVLDAATRQASSLGARGRRFIPLAVSLFFFILIANWLEIIPSQPHETGFQYLPAPTGDVNMTAALAVLVVVIVHVMALRVKRLKGYVRGYFKPYKLFFPIKVIEEIAKPVTLALRLFGNIFAGGLMILLIGLFAAYIVPPLDVGWKLFDMGIAVIQAFIFSLLTLLYLEAGMTEAH